MYRLGDKTINEPSVFNHGAFGKGEVLTFTQDCLDLD